MQKTDSLEMTLIVGERLRAGEGGDRDCITNSIDTSLSKLWEAVKDRGAWHAAVYRVSKSQTQLTA